MRIFSSCISNVSFNLIIEIVDMVSVSKFYFKTLGQVAIKIFLRKCCSNNTRKRTGTCSQSPLRLLLKYSAVTPRSPFQASASIPTLNVLDSYQVIALLGIPVLVEVLIYCPSKPNHHLMDIYIR